MPKDDQTDRLYLMFLHLLRVFRGKPDWQQAVLQVAQLEGLETSRLKALLVEQQELGQEVEPLDQ